MLPNTFFYQKFFCPQGIFCDDRGLLKDVKFKLGKHCIWYNSAYILSSESMTLLPYFLVSDLLV